MNKNKINIIFIHQGRNDYLLTALKCARESNPLADIFLIGDKANNDIDSVSHKYISDYFYSAKQFEKYYKHFSTNSYEFELFCIQRWFILRDFMKENNLESCFYADSDVLIFANLLAEQSKFENYQLALSEGTCGHNSFWNSFDAINNFCNFTKDVYSENNIETYSKLIDFWTKYKLSKKSGGICDMTLLMFYKEKYPTLVGETANIINGSTYDHNLSSKNQNNTIYNNILGIKKVVWKDNLPYVKDDTNILIRFNTLHLQGWTKKLSAKFYYRNKNIIYYLLKEKMLIFLRSRLKIK